MTVISHGDEEWSAVDGETNSHRDGLIQSVMTVRFIKIWHSKTMTEARFDPDILQRKLWIQFPSVVRWFIMRMRNIRFIHRGRELQQLPKWKWIQMYQTCRSKLVDFGKWELPSTELTTVPSIDPLFNGLHSLWNIIGPAGCMTPYHLERIAIESYDTELWRIKLDSIICFCLQFRYVIRAGGFRRHSIDEQFSIVYRYFIIV